MPKILIKTGSVKSLSQISKTSQEQYLLKLGLSQHVFKLFQINLHKNNAVMVSLMIITYCFVYIYCFVCFQGSVQIYRPEGGLSELFNVSHTDFIGVDCLMAGTEYCVVRTLLHLGQ